MTRNHLLSASVLLMMSVFGAASAHAQTEGWLRGPGSATGKDSKIEADCIKAEDGSVTCLIGFNLAVFTCGATWSPQPLLGLRLGRGGAEHRHQRQNGGSEEVISRHRGDV